jgi:hypothetical protein
VNWINAANQKRILLALIAIHAFGFVSFYPDVVTVSDETSYVLQTRLLAEGTNEEIVSDPFTGGFIRTGRLTHYPLGTALLALPFFWVGGWKFVFWMPFIASLLALWATTNWLKAEGRAPLFAAILLAYPQTIVFSRLCMSELPSLLIVSLGLFFFWRGLDGKRVVYWSAAGLLAGLSILIREGNALFFAPFFLGAHQRRDSRLWVLLATGAAGVGGRLLAHKLYLDDAFYIRPPLAFGAQYIASNIPLYTAALMVLVPGGLLFSLLYKGRRRPELIVAVAAYFFLHLVYSFSGSESGFIKSLVIGPRFFIPLLPLLAFSMAESVPRLWAVAISRWSAYSTRLESLGRMAAVGWLSGVAILIISIHAGHHFWSDGQAAIRDAIYHHTPEGSVIVTDSRATGKFLDSIYGNRIALSRHWLDRDKAEILVRRNGSIFIVQLDRSESAFWKTVAQENTDYREAYTLPMRLVLDRTFSSTERLRIWAVTQVP